MHKLIKRYFCLNQFSSNLLKKKFHEEFAKPLTAEDKNQVKDKTHGAVSSKYKFYHDEDATVILDVEEERLKHEFQPVQLEITQKPNLYDDINVERGINGVFEIADLVELLRKDNAVNIFVCKVPKEIKYVDYMCIVNGISHRHMNALAQYVKRVYKMKRHSSDRVPKIEGKDSKDWLALDLGNIALHIFSPKSRPFYDLESLWSIGAEYDKECNKPEIALVNLYERHSLYLSDLTPKTDSN